MIKILSIDGGGIRGIIPATVLAEIETRTKKPIAKMFDLVAGTSTGGIIALGLTKPNEHGHPEYTAADLVELYEKYGGIIFQQTLWHRIVSLDNLIDEKYEYQGLESVLKKYFRDTYLEEAVTNVIIPAYEIERRDSFFFKSVNAKNNPTRNFFMRDAARATSAAPFYFEPKKIPTSDLKEYYALIDGGVFANNPAMCAYVEAKTMFPNEKEFFVVSIGTGEVTHPIYYDEARNWGKIQWARPALSSVFDGVSDSVDYQLEQLLPLTESGQKRYYRFQVQLDKGSDAMDDASSMNIRSLKLYADTLIESQNDTIDQLCLELVK